MAQREIKFRFWLGHSKKMTYEHSLSSFIEVFSGSTYFSEDIIPLQFTGLHDKNGKEVFDGDILANSDRDDDDNIYVCEYDNSQASFLFTSPFDCECLEQNDYVSDLVIIGNRYENEDLLK